MLKYSAWALALVLLVLLTAAGWLFGTNSAAVWLLGRANQPGVVQVAANVDGSLWSGLDLTGLQVDWNGGHARSDRLRLELRPFDLLRLRLGFDRLALGEVQVDSIADAAPPAVAAAPAPDFAWPTLPGWLRSISLAVDALSVKRLSITGADGQTQVVSDLRGRLLWEQGHLFGTGLHGALDEHQLDADVQVDLVRRAVDADLRWHGVPFVAAWDGLRAKVALDAALSGTLQAEAFSGSDQRLALEAALVLRPDGAHIERLQLTHTAYADRVEGELQFDWAAAFRMVADLRLTHLDLSDEAYWPTDVSGSVQAELTADGYKGTVDVVSDRPWPEQGWLVATVAGDWQGLKIDELQAGWLEGTLGGSLDMDWHAGYRLHGTLQGRDVNPAALLPQLPGRLDLSVAGGLQVTPDGALTADWDGRIERGELRDRPLAGRIAGSWRNDDLILTTLDLHGDGLSLAGSGQLGRRLDLRWQVDDLAKVAIGWRGMTSGAGWLSRQHAVWSGAASGQLLNLGYGDWQVADGRFELTVPADGAGQLDLDVAQLSGPEAALDRLQLRIDGTPAQHRAEVNGAWSDGHIAARLVGGWAAAAWSGELQELMAEGDAIGSWRLHESSRLVLGMERVVVSGLRLIGGAPEERLNAAADLRLRPLSGSLRIDWQSLPLELVNPLLQQGLALSGRADGQVTLSVSADRRLELSAAFSGEPTLRTGTRELAFAGSHAELSWDRSGLQGGATLRLAGGGQVEATLRSQQPGRLELPDRATYTVRWSAVDLTQLSPWLPDGLVLSGAWQGGVNGSWDVDHAPQLDVDSSVAAATLEWRGAEGVVSLPLRQGTLVVGLQAGQAAAKLHLDLADQGMIDASLRLPQGFIRADAPLQGEASLRLEELGLLSLLLPGLANETRGQLVGELHLTGNRAAPQLEGRLTLRDASAEVPPLGLRLHGIEGDFSFDHSRVRIERLELSSGSGRLSGDGTLQLSGWQAQQLQLALRGKNVQLVQLPELLLEASPDLQLDWTPEQLSVNGNLLIPTLQVTEAVRGRVVEPSEDVVLVDAGTPPTSRRLRTLFDLQVRLGEHVTVQARGLDARLEGEVRVQSDRQGALTGLGTILVAQGQYAAYGLKLPITRGRASFSGGPLQDPVLDVLAERTVGEVKAGVQVTGTPRKPLVKLVSTPSMPDTEILSYIVLGRPLGSEAGQGDSLMLAANALLSRGESAALQEKLKRRLGIDVLEVRSGEGDGVTGSMVAVGKYLTPDLYFSFGRSLFSGENIARVRYQMGRHWEVESQFGTISGADLAYRIEFR